MNCIYCKVDVHPERVEFLNETGRTITCLNCSMESKAIGFLSYSHKTAPELVIIPANNKEKMRRCERVNRRSR